MGAGNKWNSRGGEITSGMTSTKASKYGNKRAQVLWRPWRVEGTWEEAENRDESGKRAEGELDDTVGEFGLHLRAMKSRHGFEGGESNVTGAVWILCTFLGPK